jgi:hypothetical protein
VAGKAGQVSGATCLGIADAAQYRKGFFLFIGIHAAGSEFENTISQAIEIVQARFISASEFRYQAFPRHTVDVGETKRAMRCLLGFPVHPRNN